MANQIWAQSANKTEIRYFKANVCKRHNEELTPAHIKTCENFKDSGDMENLISSLKTSNIREWSHPDIVKGITSAISTTCRIHYLQQTGEVIQVSKNAQ